MILKLIFRFASTLVTAFIVFMCTCDVQASQAHITKALSGKTFMQLGKSTTTSSVANERIFYVEIARKLLSGEMSLDDVEKRNIILEHKDFVSAQNLRQTPFPTIRKGVPISSISGRGLGVQFRTSNAEVLDLYAFDKKGNFTGTIYLPEKQSSFGFVSESIPDVNLSTMGSSKSFLIFEGSTTPTIFIVGKQAQIANLRTSIINGTTTESMQFMVSSRTRGSITFKRTNDSITIDTLNIDFDDNGSTDVSIGSETGFTMKEHETAFRIFAKDKKLSSKEKKLLASFKRSFLKNVVNI